jgi:hypothetical protein
MLQEAANELLAVEANGAFAATGPAAGESGCATENSGAGLARRFGTCRTWA